MSIMKESVSIMSKIASEPGKEKEGTQIQALSPDRVASYTTLMSLSLFGMEK
jgi:hypothetical protein